ncbi:MAG TPA: ArsB/NhaD family transporter [Thermotogota bacterium]|nr:ArsB/NhaD family transporter [Thermotogota bacterium]HRW91417.1 ArsB/NhaD family transporter [Thermotogota bacterium]
MAKIIILTIFFITYFLIITGSFKRSLIAFAMGLLACFTHLSDSLTISNIGSYVDFNTIGILIGMMVLVGILKSTGLFEYIAAIVVKSSRGNLYRIYLTLLVAVALFSSLLDNVTTILLFAPVAFLIADTANIPSTPMIFSMVFAANIGGMATIIGDPPNILVGSASGTGFVGFLAIMILPSIAMLVLTIVYFRFRYPGLRHIEEAKAQRLLSIDPGRAIVDRKLFFKGVAVFLGVIAGFVLHSELHLEASLVALSGATLIMILAKRDFQQVSSEIEWDTLFFFVGLFMLARALEDVGVISDIANALVRMSSSPFILILSILWLSALIGGFIGAVPVVTVFIPVVQQLVPVVPHGRELWWALALGACIGGNLTISGAAANMVGVGLLESNTGSRIRFLSFLKEGVAITALGLGVATLYLGMRWLMV